jgi:hypothetical protein
LPPEQKVGGSNPLGRTKFLNELRLCAPVHTPTNPPQIDQ